MMELALLQLAIEIVFVVGIILVLGAAVGRLLGRPILEAVAIGLLFLSASSGGSLYIARALEWSLGWFFVVTLVFLILLIFISKVFVFGTRYSGRKTGSETWVIILTVAAIIGATRLLTPEPQAGYSLYQAWNPLYLSASLKAGHFLTTHEMAFGDGFLGQTISYPVDTFGLTAFLKWALPFSSHVVNIAVSIATVIAAFSVLAFGLRRSVFSLFCFAILFLFFLRYGHFFRWPLVDNTADHLIYLGGATALYYLVAGEAGRVARIGSAVALAPAALARSYGSVFSAVFGLNGVLTDLWRRSFAKHFWAWIAFGFILSAMTLRELILVFEGGVYAARPNMRTIYPPSFSKSFWGTLADWGIIPSDSIFSFSIPILSFSVLALVLTLYLWRIKIVAHPKILLIFLAPLIILIGPLLVESITGYRKYSSGSKLYFVAIFFFPWYPCWLLSRNKVMQWWPQNISRYFKAATLAGVMSFFVLVFVFQDKLIDRYIGAVETYRANNTDRQMAFAIKAKFKLADKLLEIIKTPVLYLYYEPGGGLRYFLEGNLFTDFDFWGDLFQKKLSTATSFEAVLKEFGYPNIYDSYDHALKDMGRWLKTDGWKKFEPELGALAKQPYVKDIVSTGQENFYITGPSK